MKHPIDKLVFAMVVALSVAGCKEPEGVQGPKGAELKGALAGYAKRHNPQGTEENNNYSIRVTAVGADPVVYAYTDSTGRFELKNLPTGTYDILYEKKGYGYNKLMSYKFVGGSKKSYVLDNQPMHIIKYPLKNRVSINAYTEYKYPDAYLYGMADSVLSGYGSAVAIYSYFNDSVSRHKYTNIDYREFYYFQPWNAPPNDFGIKRNSYGGFTSIYAYKKYPKVYFRVYICNTCEWTYQKTESTTSHGYPLAYNPFYNYSKYYDIEKNLYVATALGDSSEVLSIDVVIP